MNTSTIRTINTTFCLLLVSWLTACGGGGETESSTPMASSSAVADSSSANPATETEAGVQNTQPRQPEAVNSTEDLVVNETFLFSSNFLVNVDVDLPANYEHLTVCYTKGLSEEPDYGNCLLRAELEGGMFSGELLLTNDTHQLVASAWDYSNAGNPTLHYWDRARDGELIRIN